MVDQRKSEQARRQLRDAHTGQFKPENKSKLPTDTMIAKYASGQVSHSAEQAIRETGLTVAPTMPGETANRDDCIVFRMPEYGWTASRRCILTPLPDGRARIVMQRYRKPKLRELFDMRGMSAGERLVSVLTLPLDLGNTSENHDWMPENSVEGDAKMIAQAASNWCDHGPGPKAFKLV